VSRKKYEKQRSESQSCLVDGENSPLWEGFV